MKKFLALILAVSMCLALISVVGYASASEEMLLDPGMEEIAEGWVDSSSENNRISYVTEEKRSGEKSIKAVTGSWFNTSKYSYDREMVYDFSVWVKGQGNISISLPCYDADGVELANFQNWGETAYGSTYFQNKTANYADWTKHVISVSGSIVPEGTKTFRITIRVLASNESTPAEMYFDDASLTAHTLESGIDLEDNLVADPTFGSPFLWNTKVNSAYDYETYHSSPVSVKISHPGGSSGNGYVQEGSQLVELKNGKLYEFGAWVKTDNCTDVETRLSLQSKSPNKWIAVYKFKPTTEWKQYKYYFTVDDLAELAGADYTTETVWRTIVETYKGGTAGNIWVDDVTIRELDIDLENNLLKEPMIDGSFKYNGYWRASNTVFDDSDNHWGNVKGCAKLGAGEGTALDKDYYFMGFESDIASGNTNFVTLNPEKEYELTFWAKASDVNSGDFSVALGTSTKKSTYSGKPYKVTPTTEWKQYKFIIDIKRIQAQSDKYAMSYTPQFALWQDDGFTGYLYIDDVTLCEVDYGYTNEDLSANMTTAVVNAAIDSAEVFGKAYFNAGTDKADIIVAVYGTNGVLEECTILQNQKIAAGHNSFEVTMNNAVTAGKRVKLFIFDSMTAMKPLKINGTEEL